VLAENLPNLSADRQKKSPKKSRLWRDEVAKLVVSKVELCNLKKENKGQKNVQKLARFWLLSQNLVKKEN